MSEYSAYGLICIEIRLKLKLEQELASSSNVRYELWDPGTRRVTRSFVNMIAASPAEIAWMPGCTAGCRVQVLHLPGSRVEGISLPGRNFSAGMPGGDGFTAPPL
jgi:hypothetical protein